jgi:hypothetical protein
MVPGLVTLNRVSGTPHPLPHFRLSTDAIAHIRNAVPPTNYGS